MCYCESNRFDSEELASLGWNEIVESPPPYEELANQHFNYQYLTYKELYHLVEDAGGELVMTHYTHFLLDELHEGPYWGNLGLYLVNN